MNKTLRECYGFTSENGDKSFDEIYRDREDLFEDCDSMIDPRMSKLFESVYNNSQTGKKNTCKKDLFQTC